MRMPVLLVVTAVVAAAVTPHVHAQTHAAPQSALDAAIDQHVREAARAREDVLRVLQHPDVQAVAGRAGIDMRQATSAVATLDQEQLASLAEQARQVESSLAGGQSRVTISTTAIIIGLLLLILIIVAV